MKECICNMHLKNQLAWNFVVKRLRPQLRVSFKFQHWKNITPALPTLVYPAVQEVKCLQA